MPSMEYRALLDRAWDLHVAKNAGYAGADNPDPWANFRRSEALGVTPFLGVLVRMSDKYIRIENLVQSPSNDRVGESIRDTLLDLSAYALIAVCLMDEEEEAAKPRPLDGIDLSALIRETGPLMVGRPEPEHWTTGAERARDRLLLETDAILRSLGVELVPEVWGAGDGPVIDAADVLDADRDPHDCYRDLGGEG